MHDPRTHMFYLNPNTNARLDPKTQMLYVRTSISLTSKRRAIYFLFSGSTPPRDVEAELKEELDAFVQAVLMEYAKLFLEPGVDVRRHGGHKKTSCFGILGRIGLTKKITAQAQHTFPNFRTWCRVSI